MQGKSHFLGLLLSSLFAVACSIRTGQSSSVQVIRLVGEDGLQASERIQAHFVFSLPFFAEDLSKVKVARGVNDYLRYGTNQNFGPASYHDGLDLRVPAGTRVRAIRAGRVRIKESPPYHSTIIIDETDAHENLIGREWHYAHIDLNTLPEATRALAKQGGIVAEGAEIAHVTKWIDGVDGIPDQISPYDGLRYDHLHLSLRVAGQDVNLGRWLDYQDTIAPKIQNVFFVKAGSNEVIARSDQNPRVTGVVDVVVEPLDLVNGSPFAMNALTAAELRILDSQKKIVFERTLDDLRVRTTLADLFLPNLKIAGQTIESQGDQFLRSCYFVLTHLSASNHFGEASATSHWDTNLLSKGPYAVEISVSDDKNNQSHIVLPVTVF